MLKTFSDRQAYTINTSIHILMHNTHLCPHTQIQSKIKTHMNTCVNMHRYYGQTYMVPVCTITHLPTSIHMPSDSQTLHHEPRPRKESVCSMSRSMLELVRKFFTAPA